MCFEGLGSDSRRVFSRFVRGSREISFASSLYRESTDSLIHHGFLFFSQTGSTPLYMACQQGQIDVVNILLANGADVNLTGFQVMSDGN